MDKVANESRTASRGARRGQGNSSRFGGRDYRSQQPNGGMPNNGMGMNRGFAPPNAGYYNNQGPPMGMPNAGFGGPPRNIPPQNSNRANW